MILLLAVKQRFLMTIKTNIASTEISIAYMFTSCQYFCMQYNKYIPVVLGVTHFVRKINIP